MSDPLVSVIVVNYNSGAYLERCLDALRDQTRSAYEVIVVDNGSNDDSFAKAQTRFSSPPFRFLSLGRNLGFAAANNRAAAEAKGDWLALLNPDAFAEPGWLTALIDAAARFPAVPMFGSTQVSANNPQTLDGAGDHYLAAGIPWRGGHGHPVAALPGEREVFSACAAAAFYRAATFRQLGGFDERFFAYCEDVDFGFRLRLIGGTCMQVRSAIVHHVGGGIASLTSPFARYHGTRNMVWTFVKNMPPQLFWPLLPLHAAALLLFLAVETVRGRGAPIRRALRDAVAGLPAIWRERRRLQASRTASARAIAAALVWDVRLYLRGAAV